MSSADVAADKEIDFVPNQTISDTPDGTQPADATADTDVESNPAADPSGKPVEAAAATTGHPPGEKGEKSPDLVEWNGPGDPENPMNWSLWRKWTFTMLLSFTCVWVTFASSVFSSATAVVAMQFHVSDEVMTLGTSLMVFGYMLGPLIWGPLSELYGRRLPLFLGYIGFIVFQVPVAVAKNVETIMLCRWLQGVFGCSPLSVVGGALADVWDPVMRGVAIPMFGAATFLGPIFGPIIGGFITDSHLGWRWCEWITLIASGFFGLLAFFICPESYTPVLLQMRAARLRRETRNWAYHSMLDEHQPTPGEMATKYILRPFAMLFQEPILFLITLYMSLIYGILYLFFEAFPVSFGEVRGWRHLGVAALPFLGVAVGVFTGIAFTIWHSRTRFARKLHKHGRVMPEERLLVLMPAAVLLPGGLFWFGWTSHPGTSWVPQVIAGAPIGFGIVIIFIQGMVYIIDVYLMFANSAIAANTIVRSGLGGGFPLFAVQMYHRLGVDWASSLLAFLTAAMAPIPVLFYIYGRRIRSWSRFSQTL